ncbi:SDR family NAD(P)-dependent oxidoreductase [Desulfatirhabdium butyrativorans]|uniref:SDR family NAD(P)-dependent oxidoreductase n=1 Tax=Desulfatirhabdium butyrativorans TaxID=340467 RepID=UPI000427F168|nr:SDR family oxidoreductase [Desulfatirhabdium butyrativorans]
MAEKVALVPGAIKGIGRAIALALLEKGYRVILNYFDWEEYLPELQSLLQPHEGRYALFRTDLTDTDAVHRFVRDAAAVFGRIDVLINNIERGGWPVVHGPYIRDQWDLELATTLRAKRWLFDACLPCLKAGGDGSVIVISSIAGITGRAGPASLVFNDGYAAANRAISSLTETWARVAAPQVRVNELMLGFIETRHAEQTRGWGLLSETQRMAILNHTLLNRTGKISDVVETVLFLIESASFMTGSVIRLDGGYVLGGEEVLPMPKGVL